MIKKSSHDLPEEVLQQLLRCEGFIDLKMPARAKKELDEIPLEYRAHFETRFMLLNLMILEENWGDAYDISVELKESNPDEPGLWIQEAYTLRRFDSIEAAREVLEKALEKFPEHSLIYYNLGCYACKLGNREEAIQRLKEAIDLNELWIKAALNDDDLESLHDEIEEWIC